MINVDSFLNSLPIVGKGFLGVFIILGIIIITTILLNAVTKKGEKNVKTILLCLLAVVAIIAVIVIYGFVSSKYSETTLSLMGIFMKK